MATILIVDDSRLNRELLRHIFDDSFCVLEAADGEEAIGIIKEKKLEISMILLDLLMPKKSGLDVLAFMRFANLKKSIPVVMITGEATVESDLKAYEYGADDIIYKPFKAHVVLHRVQNLIELYAQRRNIDTIVNEKTRALQKNRQQEAENNAEMVNQLGAVIEFRGGMESSTHIQRVSSFTKIILRHVQSNYPKYGITEEKIKMIGSAAALHDVGKIGIPDQILNKPTKLTPDEFNVLKKHTLIGCVILERFKQEDSEFHKYCYEICRWHHEKADGKGYPDGLTADETPIWAQVVGIADCFDALVSKRIYKEAFSVNEAFDIIKRGECGQFAEDVVDCFERAQVELFTAVEEGFYYDEANGKQILL